MRKRCCGIARLSGRHRAGDAARAAIATHWAIPSAPAVALTTQMVEEPRRGAGPTWSEALRRAFMHMVDRAGEPEFAHPAAWAAFTVIGVEPASR